MEEEREDITLWEVFVQPKNGLAHRHCGSVHASDKEMAILAARNVYTRRGEGNSIWVVKSEEIVSTKPNQKGENFTADDKIYRHPDFYDIPDGTDNM